MGLGLSLWGWDWPQEGDFRSQVCTQGPYDALGAQPNTEHWADGLGWVLSLGHILVSGSQGSYLQKGLTELEQR